MLTTQRAMSSAGKEMSEAMERLATGTKINNSADDPIGNSISQRMIKLNNIDSMKKFMMKKELNLKNLLILSQATLHNY